MKSLLRQSSLLITVVLSMCVCSSRGSGHVVEAATVSTPMDIGSEETAAPASPDMERVVIPGPLRSFLRMAGISQRISPGQVFPLLSRNISLNGYDQGKPTEFLILIDRYLQQARELQVLAGPSSKITVNSCDDAGTLIQILGYRLRQGCGQKTFSLETANPDRAFVTIDSGFPLVELEEALQNGTPFVYSYPASTVPALFHQIDWAQLHTGRRRRSLELVDVLLGDPLIARLYWAMAKQDTETRAVLQGSIGLKSLLPYAAVLDFYGSQISIHGGHVAVPGGASAQAGWKELVGTSPESPTPFIMGLLSKDNGWLAAYFDTLSRVSQAQQKHLTESPRLKRLYEAFRSVEAEHGATYGVFRKSPYMLVLFTRLQWEADDEPYVPGNLDTWNEIIHQKTSSSVIREWNRRGHKWDRPEQLLEGMTGLSRIETDSGPLQIYLLASEIDRNRRPGHGLSPATLKVLAGRFAQLNAWYPVFTEFPDLGDEAILGFVNVADAVDRIGDQTLRANTEGSFQATIGLWQILARQGQIPSKDINTTWLKMIQPFSAVSSPAQLFDSARSSVQELLAVAGGNANSSQAEMVDLLAGPRQDSSNILAVHLELAQKISSVLEDQRLVSLDTLFALSDGLKAMEQPGSTNDGMLALASELREFDLPRPIFTNTERIIWAPKIYSGHHAELQVKTDLTKVIKGPSSPLQLERARGQLAPFLRDTLVGLNYAYYEPPGAQMLHHNPLFVRSHDFLGVSVLGSERLWGAPVLLGAGSPAGGGAYLMGSLADLSFALATTEQDFIAPKNVQALIWTELVPILMTSATIPRWWNVTPNELHAAALYQRSGEELLAASVANTQLRSKVIHVLSDRMVPQRLEQVEHSLLRAEDVVAILPQIMPAETSYLAVEFRSRFPDESPTWGPASQQLEELRSHNAEEVSWERISRDFGVPHPTLAQTNGRELLNVKPFPFFGAYSSRLFGESWESCNLYWARLADEAGYPPAALNRLVPELTRRTIANIFATDLEDWPALLLAVRETGEEFRQGKIAPLPATNITSHLQEETVKNATAQ